MEFSQNGRRNTSSSATETVQTEEETHIIWAYTLHYTKEPHKIFLCCSSCRARLYNSINTDFPVFVEKQKKKVYLWEYKFIWHRQQRNCQAQCLLQSAERSSELSQTDLTSPGSSVTNTSVLQLAMGLIDSSTGGTTKLLLTGSHNPWPRLQNDLCWHRHKTQMLIKLLLHYHIVLLAHIIQYVHT